LAAAAARGGEWGGVYLIGGGERKTEQPPKTKEVHPVFYGPEQTLGKYRISLHSFFCLKL